MLFQTRKMPPMMRIRSRPLTSCWKSEKSGLVSLAIQVIERSRSTRVIMARLSPTNRALGCWAGGSFPAKIEMKMTLSMPRTISSTQSVIKATVSSAGLEAAISAAAPITGMRIFGSIQRLLTWDFCLHHEIRRRAGRWPFEAEKWPPAGSAVDHINGKSKRRARRYCQTVASAPSEKSCTAERSARHGPEWPEG